MRRYPGDAVLEPTPPELAERAAETAADRRLEFAKSLAAARGEADEAERRGSER